MSLSIVNSFNNELTKIYSTTTNGGITFVGNTLGLSKATNSQDAGTANAIGAFITTNPTLNVNTYPKFEIGYQKTTGTTLNKNISSSTTYSNLPYGSSILHAELIWGGTCKVPGVDYTNSINKNIIFISPGSINVIGSDYVYSTNKSSDVSVYCCRKDVTSIIKTNYNGIYGVCGVVGTVDPNNNSDNCCGWTLAIVYESNSLPYRTLNLYAGMAFVNSTSPYSLSVSDINAPASGTLSGRLAVCALGGNATIQGDKLSFGPTSSNLHELQGPRNPANNFFGSQINNDSGQTDLLGTFGNQNQDVLTNSNIVGGRQGLDITNVDISSTLTNSQTSGVAKFTTTNDNYFPQALGVQVDISAPNFTGISVSANKASVDQGSDTLDITLTFRNTGSLPAENVIYKMPLPSGFSYKDGSALINGTPPSGTVDFNTGIELGTIPANSQQYTVKFTLNTQGGSISYTLNSSFTYSFLPIGSTSSLQKTWYVNSLTIYSWSGINNLKVSIDLDSDMGLVTVGDTVTFKSVIVDTVPLPEPPSNNYWYQSEFNVQFPTGMVYKSGTLKINGSPSSASPTNGVSLLPHFQFNKVIQIEFQANITNSIPGGIYNVAVTIGVACQIGQMSSGVQFTSNTSVFQDTALFTVTPSSSFKFNNYFVDAGDTVTANGQFYVPPNDIGYDAMFTTELPSTMSYVPNSVIPANGSPMIGTSLGTFTNTSGGNIQFNIHVDSIPPNDYKYNTFSNLLFYQTSYIGYLPTVVPYDLTLYYRKILTATITANKSIVTPGENQTVEFTVTVTNQINVTIKDNTLIDNLPSGLSYVPDSLTVDGVKSSDSLSTGVSLKALTQGQSTTIKFLAKADSQPNNSYIYNNTAIINYKFETATSGSFIDNSVKASIEVYSSNILTASITSDKQSVVMGKDTIQYTITVTNPYNVTINSLVLTDNLPTGLVFVPNSLVVDLVMSNESLATGISLKSLTQGQSTTIKFLAKTDSAPTNGFDYINFATINYNFKTISGTFSPSTTNSNTNKVFISNILTAIMTVDDSIVIPKKDDVEFTIVITNKFNIPVKNIVLYDKLPYGLEYKAGTLTIDNVSSNASIETGVPLNVVGQNVPITVKFLAYVYDQTSSDKYSNYATVNYEFETTPGNTSSGSVTTNVVNMYSSGLVINPLVIKTTTYMTYTNIPIQGKFLIYDINKSLLSYTIVTYPINGYASISSKGVFTYTPKINFLGTDKFTVLIKDASFGKASITINIIVKPSTNSLDNPNICNY